MKSPAPGIRIRRSRCWASIQTSKVTVGLPASSSIAASCFGDSCAGIERVVVRVDAPHDLRAGGAGLRPLPGQQPEERGQAGQPSGAAPANDGVRMRAQGLPGLATPGSDGDRM